MIVHFPLRAFPRRIAWMDLAIFWRKIAKFVAM
jgi:hypothetical protein